ncbi:unnamed protein product [Rotaria magnacalcarata]|uniref:Uncharacterized protein n=4 Tax=Rotaria magnacalcarata TaxID=392030 RepID=A0A815XJ32_9BILA|nr:unnamed protein product [Rotaria magnacalcarata]
MELMRRTDPILHPLDLERIEHSPDDVTLSCTTSTCLFFQSTLGTCLGFSLFTIVAVAIGTIIICFTVPKQQSGSCERAFTTTVLHSTDRNSYPRSVATGNLNNDTQLDIVVANTGTNTVGIFLGYENGTFQPQTTYSTGFLSQPYSVAVGDFDNDNQLDIVVANRGTNSIGILGGYGNGTFKKVLVYSLGSSRPVSVTVADLNNDKCLDIIVTNYEISNIGILFGYGDTTFSAQNKYSTGYDSLPTSVVVADLNKDSQLDLIVSNSGTSNVAVFLGYGNGSFSLPGIYSTGVGSQPFTVAVGDLNGDKRLDIVVTNYGTSTIGALLGYGNGTFAKIEVSFIDSGFRPYSMVIGNFNNDNTLYVAVTNPGNDTIVVLNGSGNGTIASEEKYFTGFDSSPVSIVVDDFNNDNLLDLATSNNGTNNVAVFLRYTIKMFSNQTIYSTGYNSKPHWVALGDFNNDSFLDIAVVTIQTHVSIFLGYGNGTFTEQIAISEGTGSRPYSIAIGDFNNDNLSDLAITNSGTNNVAVLFGYGNGTFGRRAIFSTDPHSNPYSVALGDFNNDSFLDIAVANYGTGNVGILLGYGNGSFAAQRTFSTGNNSYPGSVALGDFNNDSILDIAVANSGTNNVGILLGYRNGTFGNQMSLTTGENSGPSSAIVTDLNNDSMLDIVVTTLLSNNVGVFLGYANGSFQELMTYFIGSGSAPTSLTSGDFNNDNVIDIAVTNYGDNSVCLLFGYGNGTFGMLTTYSTGDGSFPTSIAAGHFNHDSWLDFVVTNVREGGVGVFLGLENMYEANQSTYSTGSGSHPYSVVVSDFNNDSVPDLMIVNSAHDNVGIRLGDGNGTFGDEIPYSMGIGSYPLYATVGDFNRDNQVDIAVVNNMNESVTVSYGCGNGTFASPEIYSTGQGSRPYFVAVSDLNNDDRMDLIVSNENIGTIGIFLSYDYATFKIQGLSSTGALSYPQSIAIGDFNNDSLLDAAVANYGTSNVGIFLGIGNGLFTAQRTLSTGTGSGPYTVVVNDFNKDSRLDIAVGNTGTNNVGIFLGYGNGTFTEQTIFSIGGGSNPRSIAVSDFNKDNLLDIAVADSASSNIAILFGYGNGTFRYNISLATGTKSSPHSIVACDFNNDSLPDIAVANSLTDNVGIFLGHGNGNFSAKVTFSTGYNSLPESITVSDFNNDSFLDIAVANNLGNNIGIFLGYGNGTFAPQIVYSTGNGSIPAMLIVSDLNNDNRVDIAVANNGANNVGVFFGYGDGSFTDQILFSTGSGSQPDAIAVGDFNNDNRLDILVANNLDGNIMVLLRDSSQPFLSLTTYSTGNHSHPQSMAIADINKDYCPDIIVANSGNDNIGILLGSDNGTFMTQAAYTTGNGSQPCSVAVGDFNNDSLLDIAIANAGTNNVGILFGFGNGTFSTVMVYSIDNSLTPSSIVVADFNKDNYLDVSVVNSGSQNVFILFGNGNGTFRNSQSYSLGYGSLAYSMTIGDLNKDSWIDIVVANYAANSVDILFQTCD